MTRNVLASLVGSPLPLLAFLGIALLLAGVAAVARRMCSHGRHERRDGSLLTVWALFECERAAERARMAYAGREYLVQGLADAVVISPRSAA